MSVIPIANIGSVMMPVAVFSPHKRVRVVNSIEGNVYPQKSPVSDLMAYSATISVFSMNPQAPMIRTAETTQTSRIVRRSVLRAKNVPKIRHQAFLTSLLLRRSGLSFMGLSILSSTMIAGGYNRHVVRK